MGKIEKGIVYLRYPIFQTVSGKLSWSYWGGKSFEGV